MKYLRCFSSHTDYEEYINSDAAYFPSLNYCEDVEDIHFDPYISESCYVIRFDVKSTVNPTKILNNVSGISGIEVDGIDIGIDTGYTFSSLGSHVVKYSLVDSSITVKSAFTGCIDIVSVRVPDSMSKIDGFAFSSCSGLTGISIPYSVTNIGYNTFLSCYSLSSVVILGDISSIGSYVFDACSGLTSIVMPSGVTSLGLASFRGCRNLRDITLSPSIQRIERLVFQNCSSIVSVDIGSGITVIDSMSFFGCSKLRSVTVRSLIPPTLGGSVFGGTSSNLRIYVPIDSVDVYKGDSNWSVYADRIVGI